MDGGVEKERGFSWFSSTPQSHFVCQLSLLRRATPVGTRSPYSLPFVILPVPARSPFRFIRHWRRSTPNLSEGAFGIVQPPPISCPRCAGKVARSAERGAAKNSRMPRVIPPQLRLRSAAPPQAVAPFYAAQARRAVPYPFAKRSFQYPHSPILYTCSRQRSLFAITPSASLESSCAR